MAKKPGKFYLKVAHDGGCNVRPGKGDHFKVTAPDGSSHIMMPYNLKGNGTECAIIKWLKSVGLLTILLGVVFLLQAIF